MQQDTFVKERTALAVQPEQGEDTIDLLELFMGLLAHWTLMRKKTQIAPSTFTKMNNDQQVSMDVLARICVELNCGFDDIVQIESVKKDR